jgi:hypothetical protein
MNNLTNSQKWVIVAFIATALTLGATFFLEGDVRTFAYIVISLLVAGFAVLGRDDKAKRNSQG